MKFVIFFSIFLFVVISMPNVFPEEPINEWGTFGREEGKFNLIWDIVIDSNDNVYVADLENNRIQKFSNDGSYILILGEKEEIKINNPHGLALDSKDNVYVIDNDNHILVFNNNGTFLNSWGEELRLNSPHGIEIDKQDIVYIADTGNNRILKTTTNGTIINEFGSNGSGQGEFQSPSDVAVDSQGNIYVADRSNNRIQKFDSGGHFIDEWPSGNNVLSFPRGILVDSNDRIYVVNNGSII